MTELLLRVEDLAKSFPMRSAKSGKSLVKAVDGVSFDIAAGETLALVGESGCGKSTTARLVARLMQPTSGKVLYKGLDVTTLSRRRMRSRRPMVQMVFQDPYSSLDPRMTCREIVAEPLRVQGRYRAKDRHRIDELIERVGLNPTFAERKPGSMSGGQRQRLGIARALALEPELVILDEPVSALDASIQAQVLNLLADLQEQSGISYLFISHDLAVVRHLADRLMVMYMGRVVESGRSEDIFANAEHPYTQGLISAVPLENPSQRGARTERLSIGEPGDASNAPSGCHYRTRCYKAQDSCAETAPTLHSREQGVACFFPEARGIADIRPMHNPRAELTLVPAARAGDSA
ncbi:MAG: peptide transporter ATP-binding protein [Pseudonocardiales bacterium]|nr:peptide transporter ATP-binding protein [Pseudonocardiales bacterium]